MALGMVGAAAVGFGLGRAPQPAAVAAPPPPAQPPAAPPSDYSQRVVAYIFNSVPITREDLGEYLIARRGSEQLDNLVNKRIIEVACERHGITATAAEVEAALMRDLEPLKINKADFVKNILERRGMTLYQYKEDVLKPMVLVTKLVKQDIKPATDDELHKAFDAVYGEKRECRIIIWPKEEKGVAFKEYDDVRKDEQGFERKARTQANSALAAAGGKIKPIAHNSGVHPDVEKAAFNLRPGEVSSLIEIPEGIAVLRMDNITPPDATVKFEDKRAVMEQQVYDQKLNAEIRNRFMKLHEEAKPVLILKNPNDPNAVERAVKQELEQDRVIVPTGGKQP
jgi:hypothetical protein